MKKPFKQGYLTEAFQSRLFSEQEVKPVLRCASCGHVLADTETSYVLRNKDKTETFCQPCAKKKMRPQEETAAL